MEIIVYLKGGLGNQLFQYAYGLALSHSLSGKLTLNGTLLPESGDRLKNVSRFPMQVQLFAHSGTVSKIHGQPPRGTSIESKILTMKSRISQVLPQFPFTRSFLFLEGKSFRDIPTRVRRIALNGYFQDWQLFDHMGEILVSQLTLLSQPSEEYLLQQKREFNNVAALHIRMGDKLEIGSTTQQGLAAIANAGIRKAYQRGFRQIALFSDSENAIALVEPHYHSLIIDAPRVSNAVELLNLWLQYGLFISSQSTLSWWACYLRGVLGKRSLAQTIFEGMPNGLAFPIRMASLIENIE